MNILTKVKKMEILFIFFLYSFPFVIKYFKCKQINFVFIKATNFSVENNKKYIAQ